MSWASAGPGRGTVPPLAAGRSGRGRHVGQRLREIESSCTRHWTSAACRAVWWPSVTRGNSSICRRLATTDDAQSLAMTTDTVFDLASLTKPIATATSVMLLVEEGKIDLDERVAAYLPEFGKNGKEAITVRHLLTTWED